MTRIEEMTAEECRAEARKSFDKACESFERCDTDGFLTQWAHGLDRNMYDANARIKEDGGVATFPGLYDRATGKRVRAKLIESKYGWCWAFCDAHDKFTGRFLNDARTKRARLWKEGFEVRDEKAPAKAVITGKGYGLSGTCWVATVRTDGGYPATAE